MLDQKDLELLQGMMESVVGSRIAESEERMVARIAESEERMNARVAESEERMVAKIAESEERTNARIAESENLLLEEMDRMQTNITNRIVKIDSCLIPV
ncbi:MAG: hypothetical protein OSJ69_01360 [Acetatifactor sp.]|nr:hypothetical protein [Acetatifactor sp.]